MAIILRGLTSHLVTRGLGGIVVPPAPLRRAHPKRDKKSVEKEHLSVFLTISTTTDTPESIQNRKELEIYQEEAILGHLELPKTWSIPEITAYSLGFKVKSGEQIFSNLIGKMSKSEYFLNYIPANLSKVEKILFKSGIRVHDRESYGVKLGIEDFVLTDIDLMMALEDDFE